MSQKGLSAEEQRARGIAAMGRVERDEEGFTVYSTGAVPEAFRVWEDPHAGTRCTCERFGHAFAGGADYRCEHILAVTLALDPPADEAPAAPEAAPVEANPEPIRRVV